MIQNITFTIYALTALVALYLSVKSWRNHFLPIATPVACFSLLLLLVCLNQMLESAGIMQTRMKFISYGKERPAYLGASEPSRAQNRRADLLIRPDFQSTLTGPSS